MTSAVPSQQVTIREKMDKNTRANLKHVIKENVEF